VVAIEDSLNWVSGSAKPSHEMLNLDVIPLSTSARRDKF